MKATMMPAWTSMGRSTSRPTMSASSSRQGASTAETGTNCLTALVQHAGWQIEVLPAGNVRPHNVADLVRATRCDQVHAAPRVPVADPLLAAHPRLALGMGAQTELSAQLVGGLRQELDRLAESL